VDHLIGDRYKQKQMALLHALNAQQKNQSFTVDSGVFYMLTMYSTCVAGELKAH
jgi:hypothetical protein